MKNGNRTGRPDSIFTFPSYYRYIIVRRTYRTGAMVGSWYQESGIMAKGLSPWFLFGKGNVTIFIWWWGCFSKSADSLSSSFIPGTNVPLGRDGSSYCSGSRGVFVMDVLIPFCWITRGWQGTIDRRRKPGYSDIRAWTTNRTELSGKRFHYTRNSGALKY